MPMNEAETRFELIDPVLRSKGYRLPYIPLETRLWLNRSDQRAVAAAARAAPITSYAWKFPTGLHRFLSPFWKQRRKTTTR
jgi:hypothetical protein